MDIVRTSASALLAERIGAAIDAAGGWLPFSSFMAMALYEPGLGYYASGRRIVGRMPAGGSDFITAPELSPLFAQALAVQVRQGLDASGSRALWEFGAGSGALAAELLRTLGDRVGSYSIVELSAPLRERQRQAVQGDSRVRWLDAWPDAIDGVVVGNEVLDAMPVDLLHFDGAAWFERGVARGGGGSGPSTSALAWSDRASLKRPPLAAGFAAGSTSEIHPQAEAFVVSLAERLRRGMALFIDYGFPEAEYYHPQRSGGTLMCHRAHRADTDPLREVGDKDITAHVDFTGLALAAQDAGLDVVGYTSQARFLINCGIDGLLAAASLRERVDAQKLLHEHEMGELFKVVAFAKDIEIEPLGFASGDRRHRL
ncbi:MAG: SAM-dependent methyltransferase [Pseudomonadota bacterium]|nr:SAM-dependent methyltransferase [Pseudomonadota bacterium]